MKPCLICQTECPDDAASCHACGEGSFGAATDGDAESAAEPADEQSDDESDEPEPEPESGNAESSAEPQQKRGKPAKQKRGKQ